MPRSFSRISENLLFAVLLTALAGWLGGPVTAELPPAFRASGCFAVAAGVHPLRTDAIGTKQRMESA